MQPLLRSSALLCGLLQPLALGGTARQDAAAPRSFWTERPRIVEQLSSGAGSGSGHSEGAAWARDFVWDASAAQLHRRTPHGLRRCFEEEAELHNLVKELACGPAAMRAPAIVAALRPLYWPVSLGAVRQLLARGGVCRSAALRAAYKDYSRRHNAAIAEPRAPSARFLVYQICCGQLGNRIQSLVAAFVMALLSERTFLVSWPVSPGLSNESVSDLFEVPRGLTAWEAEGVLGRLPRAEVEAQRRHLPLHHGQLAEGWEELLCANLTAAYTEKILFVESNQYFATALALNPHYTRLVRELFSRSPTVAAAGGAEEAAGASEAEMAVGVGELPLPLGSLDIFGSLSPLLLRPTAPLRKKLKRFGQKHLGVGSPRPADSTGFLEDEEEASWAPAQTVGIQLRTKDRHPMSDRQIDAFFACAKAAAMAVTPVAEGAQPRAPAIFLATDRPSLRKELQKRHRLDGKQGRPRLVWWDAPVATDVEGMHGALLDLWLLGYADEMYMSHGSTFGYVAHGRTGVAPSIVTETGSCVRELSSEPCMHVWPFLHLTQCFDKTSMSPWFSRELCHPFDVEMVDWVDKANPKSPLSELL